MRGGDLASVTFCRPALRRNDRRAITSPVTDRPRRRAIGATRDGKRLLKEARRALEDDRVAEGLGEQPASTGPGIPSD